MIRLLNIFAPVVALCALALFSVHVVKADDSATSQPSATTGSIAVTVLDSDGNPAPKVAVQLFPQPKSSDDQGADTKPKKGKALARGRTDKDGKYTFENVATGDYEVRASIKKTGVKGNVTVSVTDAASAATLTINLEAPATQPAAQ
jgi:5-hydroxyisourate hydrolase-like protein (transthyretin family)